MSISPQDKIYHELSKVELELSTHHGVPRKKDPKLNPKTLFICVTLTWALKTSFEMLSQEDQGKLSGHVSTFLGFGLALVAISIKGIAENFLSEPQKKLATEAIDLNQKDLTSQQKSKLEECKHLYKPYQKSKWEKSRHLCKPSMYPRQWEIDLSMGEELFEVITTFSMEKLEKFWINFDKRGSFEIDFELLEVETALFKENREFHEHIAGYLREASCQVSNGSMSEQEASKIHEKITCYLQYSLIYNCFSIPEQQIKALKIIELFENAENYSYRFNDFHRSIFQDLADCLKRPLASKLKELFDYGQDCFKIEEQLTSFFTSCLFFMQAYSIRFNLTSLEKKLSVCQIKYSPLMGSTFLHGSSALNKLDSTGGRGLPSFWLKMLGFPSFTGAHDDGAYLSESGVNTFGLSGTFLEASHETLNYFRTQVTSIEQIKEQFEKGLNALSKVKGTSKNWSRIQLCDRFFINYLERLCHNALILKSLNPTLFQELEGAHRLEELSYSIKKSILTTFREEDEDLYLLPNGTYFDDLNGTSPISGRFDSNYHNLIDPRLEYDQNLSLSFFVQSQAYKNLRTMLGILDNIVETEIQPLKKESGSSDYDFPAVWVSKTRVPVSVSNPGECLHQGVLDFSEDVQFICVAPGKVEEAKKWLQKRSWGKHIEVMDLWDLGQASSNYKKVWPYFVNFIERDLRKFSALKKHVESLPKEEKKPVSFKHAQKNPKSAFHDFIDLNFLSNEELTKLNMTHFLIKREDQNVEGKRFVVTPGRRFLFMTQGGRKFQPEVLLYPIADISHLSGKLEEFPQIFEIINDVTINTPYPGNSGYKCKNNEGFIYRINHNGTHSCRQAYYMQNLLESLEKISTKETKEIFKSFSNEEKNALILAAFMMRSGRVDETSHKDYNPDNYYLRSAILFKAYASQLSFGEAAVNWAYKLVANSCKPKGVRDSEIDSSPKDLLAHQLLSIVHNLDLARCFPTSLMTLKFSDILSLLQSWLPKNEAKPFLLNLEKMALEALKKTGSYQKYQSPNDFEKSSINEALYYSCSTSGAYCWERLVEA